MLDQQMISRKVSARDDIVDVAQLDNIDDIRLGGRRELLLAPLPVSRFKSWWDLILTEAICIHSCPSLTTTGTCCSWSDRQSKFVKTCSASYASAMVYSGRARLVKGMNSASSAGDEAAMTCLPTGGTGVS